MPLPPALRPIATAFAPPACVAAPDDGQHGERCVTCGALAGTPFCAQCGEQRAADRPRTLRALVDELWDAFSPIDGRVGRTFWSLLRRPGELTAAYMRGERAPYMPPLRLFLFVNVLFFVYASAVGNRTFDTPLGTHLDATRHRAVAQRFVRGKLDRLEAAERAQRNVAQLAPATRDSITADYARRFNATSTTQAKSLVIALVPLFTVFVTAVEWRRRRHLLQDVVLAVHAMAFLLLLAIAARYVVGAPIALVLSVAQIATSNAGNDMLFTGGMMLLFAGWVRAALRRAYGDGAVAATLKAIALAASFGVVLFSYRALLFFTTFYATR